MQSISFRVLLIVTILMVSAANGVADDRVEFNRDIRPILSDNCFYCHGNDGAHREAGLRLDSFEGATDDLGGYRAIEPKDSEASELMIRILSDDPDTVMPPPDSEKEISQEQQELIRRWIDQGAEYQEHWAWSPLVRPAVPGKTKDLSGPHAIDAFLRSGWKDNDAQVTNSATPRERVRRLSLDLRGLLPTQADVDAFEANPSDEQFAMLRDRWMSDRSYGEHQAVRWLDLVRWADTSGFVSDEPIASGAYRAWIINAIQDNQPFDQFSREQFAGDLLANPTDDQLIASGYNRIVNTNCEAGGIEAEQLYKLKGEHVRAIGTVWLGMTTGCAECHDHKFDPFSAKDYYSLAAFFDDLVEAGVYTPGDRREPLHYVHKTLKNSSRDRRLESQIAGLRKKMTMVKRESFEGIEAQVIKDLNDKKTRDEFVWLPAKLPAARILEGTYESTRIDGRPARRTIAPSGELHRHHVAELMTGYVSVNKKHADDAWFVDVWIDENNRPGMIGLQISNGKYGRLGWTMASYETYYWGEDTEGVLASEHRWSSPGRVLRMGDVPQQNGWVRLRVPFEKQIKPVGGKSFEKVGMAWLHGGGSVAWGDSGQEVSKAAATELRLGETAIRKWWQRPYNRQFYQSRMKGIVAAFLKLPNKRNDLQNELVDDALRELASPQQMARLRHLESDLFSLRSDAMPVLVSRKSPRRKTTRLLKRGDYQHESGPLMTPATPEFLDPIHVENKISQSESPKTLSRLDLANWLFSDGHPLVARVYVNRLWHQFYGRRLCETLEDVGTQGDWPSNVALLDWLACEFRDSGWDRNHMVSLLTSTKAYGLSSNPSSDLRQRDPTNR
ncbi:MAG: PSD1 and planctomycete cytochrome C domain-containing protein [Planctomycetota bacterium]